MTKSVFPGGFQTLYDSNGGQTATKDYEDFFIARQTFSARRHLKTVPGGKFCSIGRILVSALLSDIFRMQRLAEDKAPVARLDYRVAPIGTDVAVEGSYHLAHLIPEQILDL